MVDFRVNFQNRNFGVKKTKFRKTEMAISRACHFTSFWCFLLAFFPFKNAFFTDPRSFANFRTKVAFNDIPNQLYLRKSVGFRKENHGRCQIAL